MKADQERVRNLLKESISILCKNGLTYNQEITVEGLLGVTVDKREIFLVSVNELLKSDECELSSSQPSDDCADLDVSPLKRPASTPTGAGSAKKRRIVTRNFASSGETGDAAQVPTTSGMSVTAGDAVIRTEEDDDQERDMSQEEGALGQDVSQTSSRIDDSLELSADGQDSSVGQQSSNDMSRHGGGGPVAMAAGEGGAALGVQVLGSGTKESAAVAAALVNQASGPPRPLPGRNNNCPDPATVKPKPNARRMEHSLREQLQRVLARCYDDEAEVEAEAEEGGPADPSPSQSPERGRSKERTPEGAELGLKKRTQYDSNLIKRVLEFAELHGNRPASREFGLNESTIRGWRMRNMWSEVAEGAPLPLPAERETDGRRGRRRTRPAAPGRRKRTRTEEGEAAQQTSAILVPLSSPGQVLPLDVTSPPAPPEGLGTFTGAPMYVLPGGVLQIPDAPAHAQQAATLLSHVDTSAAGGMDPMSLLTEGQSDVKPEPEGKLT